MDYGQLMKKARALRDGGETIEWEEGMEVMGELLSKRWSQSQYNADKKYLTLTIQKENGDVVRAPCSTVLEREMEEQRIMEGMIVAISCGGKGKTKAGKEFWKFGVVAVADADSDDETREAEDTELVSELDNTA